MIMTVALINLPINLQCFFFFANAYILKFQLKGLDKAAHVSNFRSFYLSVDIHLLNNVNHRLKKILRGCMKVELITTRTCIPAKLTKTKFLWIISMLSLKYTVYTSLPHDLIKTKVELLLTVVSIESLKLTFVLQTNIFSNKRYFSYMLNVHRVM